MQTLRIAGVIAALAGVPIVATGPAATAAEVSKDIIAVQIRRQGFECDDPQSATRDEEASKPDAEVWVLACEGMSYRVQLIPDQAAKVERLADKAREAEQAEPTKP